MSAKSATTPTDLPGPTRPPTRLICRPATDRRVLITSANKSRWLFTGARHSDQFSAAISPTWRDLTAMFDCVGGSTDGFRSAIIRGRFAECRETVLVKTLLMWTHCTRQKCRFIAGFKMNFRSFHIVVDSMLYFWSVTTSIMLILQYVPSRVEDTFQHGSYLLLSVFNSQVTTVLYRSWPMLSMRAVFFSVFVAFTSLNMFHADHVPLFYKFLTNYFNTSCAIPVCDMLDVARRVMDRPNDRPFEVKPCTVQTRTCWRSMYGTADSESDGRFRVRAPVPSDAGWRMTGVTSLRSEWCLGVSAGRSRRPTYTLTRNNTAISACLTWQSSAPCSANSDESLVVDKERLKYFISTYWTVGP